MAKLLSGTRIYGTATVDTQLFVSGSNVALSTITGALRVVGGIGVGGAGHFGGNVNAPTFIGALTGVATTATNLASGAVGSLPYQSSAGTTAMLSLGINGYVLTAGATAPQWTAISNLTAGLATTATNVGSGLAGQLVFQSSPGITSFVTTAATGFILSSNGSSAPSYVSQASLSVGTATSSTRWTIARTVTFTGDTTGTFTIDGSANVSGVNLTIQPNSVALGTDTTGDYVATGATNGFGLSGSTTGENQTFTVTSNATSSNTVSTLVFRDASGNFAAGTITANLTGVATTATLALLANTATLALSANASTNVAGGSTGSVVYQSATGTTAMLTLGTTGHVLTAGATAPQWTAISGLSAGFATTATNIAGGTAGQVPYQSSTGTTSFYGPGTAGDVLVSNGTNAPSYQNTLSLTGTTAASSTNTGALQVVGGVGIGGNLYVGGATSSFIGNVGVGTTSPSWKVDTNLGTINASSISTGGYNVTGDATTQVGYTSYNIQLNNSTANASGYMRLARTASTAYLGMQIGSQSRDGIAFLTGAATPTEQVRISAAGIVTISTTTNATSTSTGALQVIGGVGIGGNLYVGGEIVAQKLTIQFTTVTTTLIQTDDVISTYNATVSTSTNTGALQIVGGAGIGGRINAGGLISGAAGANITGSVTATTFFGALTGTATNATNVIGGAAGSVVYQSAANTTAMLALGTAGFVLTAGASAPQWTAVSGLSAGLAATATNVVITNDTSTITPQYITFVSTTTSASGTSLKAGSASSLNYIPSSGFHGIGIDVPTSPLHIVSSVNSILRFRGGTTGTIGILYSDANIASLTNNSTSESYAILSGTNALSMSTNATTRLTIDLDGQVKVITSTAATSTSTGALVVNGGVGIGNRLYVGGLINGAAGANVTGSVTATTFVGALTGTASRATNVVGGSTGSLHYQSAVDVTAMLTLGTVGQVLTAGATAPQWTSISGLTAGLATTATNVAGGSTGSIVYQSGAGTTAMLAISTAGYFLTVNAGATAPQWTQTLGVTNGGTGVTTLTGVAFGNGTSAFTAATGAQISTALGTTNISGNAANVTGIVATNNGGTGLSSWTAGDIPFYSSGTVLSKLALGTNGFVLTAGATAPQWTSIGSLTAGIATTATQVRTTAQANNANYFPTFVDSNNATATGELVYTTSSFSINPSTNVISLNGVALAGTVNSQSTVARFNVVTGNTDSLEISNVRGTAGADYTTAGFRIQQKVDSTWMGYIQFNGNPSGANNGGMSFGAGTTTVSANSVTERLRITSTGDVIVLNTTAASSTATGALQVRGGVGIGGDTYVGGNILSVGNASGNTRIVIEAGTGLASFIAKGGGTATTLDNQYGTIQFADSAFTNKGFIQSRSIDANNTRFDFIVLGGGSFVTPLRLSGTSAAVALTTAASSTTTGALTVAGGVGIGGGLFVGGTVTATNFVGAFSGAVTGAASQVQTTAQATNASYFPTFVDANNASAAAETIFTTSSFVINPQSGNITQGPGAPSSWSSNYAVHEMTPGNGNGAIAFNGAAASGGVIVSNIFQPSVGAPWQYRVQNQPAALISVASGASPTISFNVIAAAGAGISTATFAASAPFTVRSNGFVVNSGPLSPAAAAYINGDTFVTGVVTATTFFGNITGAVTGAASQVQTAQRATNAAHFLTFVDSHNPSATGELVYTTSTVSVNPSTGRLDAPVLSAANTVRNSADYFERVFPTVASFPNATANQAVDIRIGNISVWGYIEVEVNSSYSNQNSTGKLTKLFAIGTNPSNLIYANESRVVDTLGSIDENIAIGDFQWDAINTTYKIPVSHIVSTGNDYTIKVRCFGFNTGADTVLSNLSISSRYTLTALPAHTGPYYNTNVGFGAQTLPAYPIDVTGGARITGGLGIGTAPSGTAGEIRATNEITAYYSDRRLKENVKLIDNAVEKVLSLNGIIYTPNDLARSFGYTSNKTIVGLFADEVDAVLPEAVRPAPFDQDENGNSKSGANYQTIQYEKIVPLLVEAIKEQQKQIAQLSEMVSKLVNK